MIRRIKEFRGLLAVLALAAIPRFYQLGHGGFGTSSVSGTVRSMLHSWRHFFFIAWDPAGTYMHDKPPLVFWIQGLSAHVLGYNGLALMLPQAIAGMISIVLLYTLIKNIDGRKTLALFSSAVMGFLPVSVLVSRSNKVDEWMITLVLAVACLLVAYSKKRKPSRLYWAALVAGLAFNVKGFAMIFMVPSLLVLLVCAKPWRRTFARRHLVLSALVFMVVAFGWITVVEITPKNHRPRVMHTDNNSFVELMIHHNGLSRLSSSAGFDPVKAMRPTGTSAIPSGVLYGGQKGVARILGEFPGGMIAYLLPLVFAGIVFSVSEMRRAGRRVFAIFWLMWLVLGWAAFSYSRMGASHYLELFAAPLSVMAGIALSQLIEEVQWKRLLACVALLSSGLWIFLEYRTFTGAGPWVLVLGGASLVAMLVSFFLPPTRSVVFRRIVGMCTVALFLFVPYVFSLACVIAQPTEGYIPGAIFLELQRRGEGNPAYSSMENRNVAGRIDDIEPALRYMDRQEPDIKYLTAAPFFSICAAITTHFNRSAVPLYNEPLGRPENTPADLKRLIYNGELRYILVKKKSVQMTTQEMKSLLKNGKNITAESGLPADSPWVLYDISIANSH